MFSTRVNITHKWSNLKIAAVGIVSGGIIIYNPMKNTFAIDHLVKRLSLKSSDDGKPIKLPSDLHEEADEIRNQARIDGKAKNQVQFFLSKELDVVHVGNLNLINGAKIGIPFTYIYEKAEDIDPKLLTAIIGERKLSKKDWHKTEYGEKLINSLILSKEAKKFGILRGIMAADSEDVIFRDMLACAAVFGVVVAYEFLEPRTKATLGRIPTILGLGSMCVVIFSMLSMIGYEIVDHYFAKSIDSRSLRNPNENFRKGSLEYYEKLIERNKALRGLLVDGTRRFDADGNQISWYQINFSSLKDRLDNCKKTIDTWVDEKVNI